MMMDSPVSYGSLSIGETNIKGVIELAEKAKFASRIYEAEMFLVVDVTDRRHTHYIVRNPNGLEKRPLVKYLHDSKQNTMLLRGITVLAEKKCVDTPMDEFDFKTLLEDNKRNIDKSHVNNWLKSTITKRVFEMNGTGIKPRYLIKEVRKK